MKPLKRVGPRGSGEFEEISWDEALTLAADRLGKIRKDDPKKLAFFTGRDQSQSFTGFWAQAYGTPNFAACDCARPASRSARRTMSSTGNADARSRYCVLMLPQPMRAVFTFCLAFGLGVGDAQVLSSRR